MSIYKLTLSQVQKEFIEKSVIAYEEIMVGNFRYLFELFDNESTKESLIEIRNLLFPENSKIDTMKKEFTLKNQVNQQELLEIIFATEFIARIRCGDLMRIQNIVPLTKSVDHLKIKSSLTLLKNELYPEFDNPQEYYGIYNKNVDEESKIIYDIYQVLRNSYAKGKELLGDTGFNTLWSFEPKISSDVSDLMVCSLLV